jgi:hypothetical protein
MATQYTAFCGRLDKWIAGGLELKREAEAVGQELFGGAEAAAKTPRIRNRPAAEATDGTKRGPGRPRRTAAAPAEPLKLTPKEVPAWFATTYPNGGCTEEQLITQTGLSKLQYSNFKRMVDKSGAMICENGIWSTPVATDQKIAA